MYDSPVWSQNQRVSEVGAAYCRLVSVSMQRLTQHDARTRRQVEGVYCYRDEQEAATNPSQFHAEWHLFNTHFCF